MKWVIIGIFAGEATFEIVKDETFEDRLIVQCQDKQTKENFLATIKKTTTSYFLEYQQVIEAEGPFLSFHPHPLLNLLSAQRYLQQFEYTDVRDEEWEWNEENNPEKKTFGISESFL